ncbi:MAG: hypothetical protein OXI81_12965 [Paracoccaceae bacterium]|nr:hypothetical protein [Paracoccaceae bacterium]MDE2911793.1 hypothetical protein [Paracoccaceae bacterium]
MEAGPGDNDEKPLKFLEVFYAVESVRKAALDVLGAGGTKQLGPNGSECSTPGHRIDKA